MQLPVKFYFLSEHFAGKWLIFVYLGCPTKKTFSLPVLIFLSLLLLFYAYCTCGPSAEIPVRERETEKDLHVNNRDKLKLDRETMSKGVVLYEKKSWKERTWGRKSNK